MMLWGEILHKDLVIVKSDLKAYHMHLLLQYFNYMGMLAVEGTYDKMEALLSEKIHPVDILLLMAASEGDKPKIEELLRAGANYTVKDADGKTALDRASDETKEFILNFQTQKAWIFSCTQTDVRPLLVLGDF